MPTEKRVPSLIVNTLTEAQYQALENPSDTEMWVTPYDESILPSQTGQSGKFLTTDGTDASWATVNALQNTATGTNSLTVLGTAATNSRAINIGATSVAVSQGTSIGYGSRAHTYSVAVGDNAYTYEEYATAIGQSATCTARASVALGSNANSRNGSQNVAIGSSSETGYNVSNGTAVGYSAKAQASGATAIGYNAIAENSYSIQLGRGTNSTANTLSVGLSSSNNYQLLDANGKIPEARLPDTSQKVSKTGDTMTGALTINKASDHIIAQDTVLDVNTTPSSLLTGGYYSIRDKNGNLITRLYASNTVDGYNISALQVWSGTSANTAASMGLRMKLDGTDTCMFGPTPTSTSNTNHIATTAWVRSYAPYITQTYIKGTSWYRVWSNGWCEQGGYSSSTNITFLKQMANTNYTISIGNYRNGTATSGDFRYITAYSVTGFTKALDANETFWWRVEGNKAK